LTKIFLSQNELRLKQPLGRGKLRMANVFKWYCNKYAILISLSLLVLVVLAPSNGETENAFFTENFEGTTLDPSKWLISENTNQSGYPAYGGSIKLADSHLLLSSSGSSFPFIYSASNPFPTSGDFEIEFAVEYDCIADLGCGVMISHGIPSLDENWHKYKIVTLWAHDQGPETTMIFVQVFDSLVYQITVPGFKPSSPEHIYKIRYVNGTYIIHVDGISVAKVQSQLRPNMIVLGNPPNPEVPRPPTGPTGMAEWGYWGWSSFKVDYISVGMPTGDDSLEENEFLIPTEVSLSTDAKTEQLGYKIKIFGDLIANDQPIPDAQIILSVSIPGIYFWQPITSMTTNSEGIYTASWIPMATGEFSLKAEYLGDSKFAKSYEVKNISITESPSKSMFLVESNSTLSSLAFNSTSNEMSFKVSGQTGTEGYVRFTVSKEIVPDPMALVVYMDSRQLEYTVTDFTDTWQLYFSYSHSEHTVLIAMPYPLYSGLLFPTTIIILVSASIVLLALGVLVHKKRKLNK
jgi:hypothetical protein